MADVVTYELTIDAPPPIVFDLLTDRALLLQWLAIEAEVDLRPGGVISWTHANGQKVVGRYLEIDRPRRLVFTYGWEDNPKVGPGETVVEITLTTPVPDGGTHLRLAHRDLPSDERASHLGGWRHFLGELATLATTKVSTS